MTFVEFPQIVRYSKFSGNVLFPTLDDYSPIDFKRNSSKRAIHRDLQTF
ncbi:hypothetical protein [Thermococcus sp.]|nr:hypothetical protein [Thermococcus sp.]